MWSVWSKFLSAARPMHFHVHLGRGYALLRSAGQASKVLHFPEDLPMDRILSRVSSVLPAQAPTRWMRKHAVHVTLGATLCRPLAFTVPGALQSWQELQLVANAQAAQATQAAQISGHPPQSVQCALSFENTGLAGVIHGEVLNPIQDWAASHQFHLASVAPLWSIASACKAVHAKSVDAIAVHEPEGCTLLTIKADAQPQAITLPPISEGDNSSALLRRHWVSMDVAESAVFHIYFATPVQASLSALPALWSGHWSMR